MARKKRAPKAANLPQSTQVTSNTCFVVMPFSKTTEEHPESYWTEHYEKFLKPLIEENTQLKVKRSEAVRGNLQAEIILELVNAPVVVVDTTDNNANVFWELGVRQSFKHGTITIRDVNSPKPLPCDISNKGTLTYYPNDHIKMEEFRKAFKTALTDCVHNPQGIDSTVLEVIGGRGSLVQTLDRDQNIRRLEALLNECESNIKALDSILSTLKTNSDLEKENKGNEGSINTNRLSTVCVEWLITNRYLDEATQFYDQLEKYYASLVMVNGQLSTWETSPKSTEKWLQSYLPAWQTRYQAARDILVTSKQKLLKQTI